MATLRNTIVQANSLRPNTIPEEEKAKLLYELDNSLVEMMEIKEYENRWPEDQELLMPNPYDNIYRLYLISMIDFYMQDLNLYANDKELFNQAMKEAKAWWRRNHRPKKSPYWEGL